MTVISNADAKVWLALLGRIDDWTECPVHLPMENYNPTASDTFIIVQHVTTDFGGVLPINIECGQPLPGFLNISVMVPIDVGYSSTIGLAGRVADFFVNNSRFTYSDVSVRINGRSRIVGGVTLNEPWNRMEVQVPFVAWG